MNPSTLDYNQTLTQTPIGQSTVTKPREWSQKVLFGDKLPTFSGLYAVYYGDKLVYVGKSTNISSRLKQREFLFIQNVYPEIQVYIRYLPLKERALRRINGEWISVDLLSLTETRYIKLLNPPLNRTNNKDNTNFLNPKPAKMRFYKNM